MRIPVTKGSLFFLVIVPAGLMFQGIDFTDTGWVLSNYQQIFLDPQSVSYWFHLWLPNIIGGIWNAFFGWGGLLSFKVAAVFIFWITAFCVYKVYKGFVSLKYLFPALLLGMVFHFPGKITVIHYNNISMLVLTLGAAILFFGLEKKSRPLIFLSGMACSLAVFARIPNIAGMAFVLVLVYAWMLEKGRLSGLVKNIGFFFLGVLAAAAIVTAAMFLLGHLSIYRDAVGELFAGTKENLSHYGANTMEKKFFVDWARALFAAGLMLGGFSCANIIIKKIPVKHFRLVCFAALALISSAVTWNNAWSESMVIVYPFIGCITLTCALIIVFAGNEYKKQKLLALITILLTGTLSVGSDTGMKVGAYAMIFGFPLLLWYWFELPETRFVVSTYQDGKLTRESRISWGRLFRRNLMTFILVLYIAYSIPFTFRNVYRDSSLRWKMNAQVNHSMLRGVFTSPERSAAIESLLAELERYVKPGDVLLAYESIPMLHFITQTRPYLYNPWPILYLPGEFDKKLKRASLERAELPVAVLAKVEMRSGSWPESGEVNMAETSKAARKLVHAFLAGPRYVKVWENEAFEIFLPAGE
jgi:hypothetical protein